MGSIINFRGGYVFAGVCLFVSKITPHFQEMLIMGQGTDNDILVMFWISIWIQDFFEGVM